MDIKINIISTLIASLVGACFFYILGYFVSGRIFINDFIIVYLIVLFCLIPYSVISYWFLREKTFKKVGGSLAVYTILIGTLYLSFFKKYSIGMYMIEKGWNVYLNIFITGGAFALLSCYKKAVREKTVPES